MTPDTTITPQPNVYSTTSNQSNTFGGYDIMGCC